MENKIADAKSKNLKCQRKSTNTKEISERLCKQPTAENLHHYKE
ncbi:hypothetical protein AM1_4267 [Acaryochloris marina MBIC11017]|uniref:Uncharacterized protein n=1 Tax=Acaryochloris marina (strain MBIC 11017) TaxID=329726 RepID=B0CCT4_ACAM1|nr:hypothetical protein AM1_4267 [Acaryochloris marina MBIC11017]